MLNSFAGSGSTGVTAEPGHRFVLVDSAAAIATMRRWLETIPDVSWEEIPHAPADRG